MNFFNNYRSLSKFTSEHFEESQDKLPRDTDIFFKDIVRGKSSIDGDLFVYPNDTNAQERSKLFFDSIFKKYNQISIPKQKYYEEAIKLFFNQSFHGSPIVHIQAQAICENLHFSPRHCADIRLGENSLYITISFYITQVLKQNSNFPGLTEIDNFEQGAILNGKATYKVEINPAEKKGWAAKYGLIDSTIECKDKYKKIFDTRTILEKFIDFFTALIKKIAAYINWDLALSSNPTIKSNPIIFISKEGELLDEQIINPPKDCLSRYSF